VFKLDLQSVNVKKMKKMPSAKQAFGVCCVCNHIYVVGGFEGEYPTDSCERYDVLNDSWEKLPLLPLKAFAINLVVIGKRFIVAFGLTRNSED